MTEGFAQANGIRIAYRVHGAGPPLVLVMGYRLSSAAWPPAFIEALARRFTVVTLDNRGTGLSDKPVHGYAIANLARDLCGLLDELDLTRVHLLGYSMGGAIAQEFIRQFPERVESLMLCATMCGGRQATYAKPSVTRVMRDLDGLSPAQIARRIWQVTYAPDYLERHRPLAEEQARREIAFPTPLHAADLQFQAFAEFDGSRALGGITCPTLVLTGDLDQLIPPQNSVMMAGLIPGARLAVVPGGGHRVLWEAPGQCVDLIDGFLRSASTPAFAVPGAEVHPERAPSASSTATSTLELFATLPSILTSAVFDTATMVRQTLMVGSASRFGDGKPIVLVPEPFAGDLALLPFSMWLKALGYRPVTAAGVGSSRSLADEICEIAQRVGRKAVLVAHASSMTRVMGVAQANSEWVSDVIIFDPHHRPSTEGLRVHFLSTGWPPLYGMVELPRLLRRIGIELVEGTGWMGTPQSSDARLTEEGRP